MHKTRRLLAEKKYRVDIACTNYFYAMLFLRAILLGALLAGFTLQCHAREVSVDLQVEDSYFMPAQHEAGELEQLHDITYTTSSSKHNSAAGVGGVCLPASITYHPATTALGCYRDYTAAYLLHIHPYHSFW